MNRQSEEAVWREASLFPHFDFQITKDYASTSGHNGFTVELRCCVEIQRMGNKFLVPFKTWIVIDDCLSGGDSLYAISELYKRATDMAMVVQDEFQVTQSGYEQGSFFKSYKDRELIK